MVLELLHSQDIFIIAIKLVVVHVQSLASSIAHVVDISLILSSTLSSVNNELGEFVVRFFEVFLFKVRYHK